ncbi:Amino acid permease 1, partial [Linum perenne]
SDRLRGAIAQLGWVVGPMMLVAFSAITWFTSTLLADAYRSPVSMNRNPTYMDAVRASLGGWKVKLCGIVQYCCLIGTTVGYTITAAMSMGNVKKSQCYHVKGSGGECAVSNKPFMIIFGCIQIALSQIPEFHKLSCLSIFAAIMSFSYSTIDLGLSISKVAAENKAMKRASSVGIMITSPLYFTFYVVALGMRPLEIRLNHYFHFLIPYFKILFVPDIARQRIPKFTIKWTLLKMLSWTCLMVSLLAAIGSVEGLIQSLKKFRPFT